MKVGFKGVKIIQAYFRDDMMFFLFILHYLIIWFKNKTYWLNWTYTYSEGLRLYLACNVNISFHFWTP